MFLNTERRVIVLGGPGCGKTTKLLDMLDGYLKDGYSSKCIAFVSFTNKAVNEAATRAAAKFDLKPNDLPHFRTIHSMAYRGSGIRQSQVMQRQDYRALGEMLGVVFSNGYDLAEGGGAGATPGDQMLSLVNLARSTAIPLSTVWAEMDSEVGWYELLRFAKTLDKYKEDFDKVDFADMLERFVALGDALDIDIAIIDEAQDLSRVQWQVASKAFGNAKEIVIAGDDDQAIHEWNGADVDTFLEYNHTDRVDLPVSYRLSKEVHDVGKKIALRIKHRLVKTWEPATHEGTVAWVPDINLLNLGEGEWMLLARNKVFLRDVESTLRQVGFIYRNEYGPSAKPDDVTAIYTWERLRNKKPVKGKEASVAIRAVNGKNVQLPDGEITTEDIGMRLPYTLPWFEALKNIPLTRREYYRAALRRGESLTKDPRITVGTIHSVKGGEADNVALLMDMTARTYQHYEKHPDQEHRVFYVGATRARRYLALVPAQGSYGYDL